MGFTKEELDNEIWKDIPDYEGFYQASNLGRIKSCDRPNVKCRGNGLRTTKGKILSQSNTTNGYLKTSLCINNVTTYHFVHRLVAAAFLGKSNLVVNHKNENKKDNRIENLEYLTNVENLLYGTGQQRSKAAQHRTPVESYDLNTGETIMQFESQKEALRNGYDQKCVWNCCNGKSKSYKGMGWRYVS